MCTPNKHHPQTAAVGGRAKCNTSLLTLQKNQTREIKGNPIVKGEREHGIRRKARKGNRTIQHSRKAQLLTSPSDSSMLAAVISMENPLFIYLNEGSQ